MWIDGAKIVEQMGIQSNKAIVEMLTTAREPPMGRVSPP
jgi:hypothetical protein